MTDQVNDNQDTTTQGSEQEPTTSPYDELLQQIVNDEGKPKYSTVEEALKANLHAQQHIQTLEEENSKYKQETTRMEELLNSLQNESQAATQDKVATTTQSESPTPEDTATQEEQLLAKLQARMSEQERQRTQEANKKQALEKVQSIYSDKSAEYMKEKAASLGVSTDFLLNTAATSPQAFYSLVGLNNNQQSKSFNNSSSVNSTSFETQPKQEYTGDNPLKTGRSRDAVALWNSL